MHVSTGTSIWYRYRYFKSSLHTSVIFYSDSNTRLLIHATCNLFGWGLLSISVILGLAQKLFTHALIVPSLDKDDPKATVLNSLDKALAEDVEFVKSVKVQSLKLIYKYIQDKHIELMSCLESLSEKYHSLPFHQYFAKTIPIPVLNKEAEAILWHQRLVHYGSHSLKGTSLYVDGLPNLSAFNFDDILKCPTCLKTNLTKKFGKKSLRDSVGHPYQGLFIDFAFLGKVKQDKDGVVNVASKNKCWKKERWNSLDLNSWRTDLDASWRHTAQQVFSCQILRIFLVTLSPRMQEQVGCPQSRWWIIWKPWC